MVKVTTMNVMTTIQICRHWPEHRSWRGCLEIQTPCVGCRPAFTRHDTPPPLQPNESIWMWWAWQALKKKCLAPSTWCNSNSAGIAEVYCQTLLMHRIIHYSLLIQKGVFKVGIILPLITSTYCQFGMKLKISGQ